METMEFNLLREPWVRVRTQDGTIRTVSLTDALLHAHAYVDLAGEMPTQDAAMLRLLLAVLHTVFSRVDGNGVLAPFEEPRDALQRWGELWQLGHFPEQPIRDYLDKWLHRRPDLPGRRDHFPRSAGHRPGTRTQQMVDRRRLGADAPAGMGTQPDVVHRTGLRPAARL